MITEFSAGILKATALPNSTEWNVTGNMFNVAVIQPDGTSIRILDTEYLDEDMLLNLLVIMRQIKRQYKLLQG